MGGMKYDEIDTAEVGATSDTSASSAAVYSCGGRLSQVGTDSGRDRSNRRAGGRERAETVSSRGRRRTTKRRLDLTSRLIE